MLHLLSGLQDKAGRNQMYQWQRVAKIIINVQKMFAGLSYCLIYIMAIPVMEFLNQGYKIRKIFNKISLCFKYVNGRMKIIEF
jgi:hypothetical protein